MKRISVLIIVLTMLMSLCACNSGDKPYESATSTDITDKELQEIIEQAEKAQKEAAGQ